MKLVLLAIWLAFPVIMFSQCSTNPSGGTVCVGPISSIPQAGKSPTGIIQLTPATTKWPCLSVAATNKTYALCGQNGAITVDLGDGNGYVTLKGAKGDTGATGAQGPQGNSIVGPPGPAWSTSGHLFSIKCATGGKGVPNFSVTNCTITQTQ